MACPPAPAGRLVTLSGLDAYGAATTCAAVAASKAPCPASSLLPPHTTATATPSSRALLPSYTQRQRQQLPTGASTSSNSKSILSSGRNSSSTGALSAGGSTSTTAATAQAVAAPRRPCHSGFRSLAYPAACATSSMWSSSARNGTAAAAAAGPGATAGDTAVVCPSSLRPVLRRRFSDGATGGPATAAAVLYGNSDYDDGEPDELMAELCARREAAAAAAAAALAAPAEGRGSGGSRVPAAWHSSPPAPQAPQGPAAALLAAFRGRPAAAAASPEAGALPTALPAARTLRAPRATSQGNGSNSSASGDGMRSSSRGGGRGGFDQATWGRVHAAEDADAASITAAAAGGDGSSNTGTGMGPQGAWRARGNTCIGFAPYALLESPFVLGGGTAMPVGQLQLAAAMTDTHCALSEPVSTLPLTAFASGAHETAAVDAANRLPPLWSVAPASEESAGTAPNSRDGALERGLASRSSHLRPVGSRGRVEVMRGLGSAGQGQGQGELNGDGVQGRGRLGELEGAGSAGRSGAGLRLPDILRSGVRRTVDKMMRGLRSERH